MSNPSSTPAQSSKDKFAVPVIPPFKGASSAKPPINYAAAAGSKSKPSPAVVNGKDATATVIGSTAGTAPAAQAISAIGGAPSGAGLARKQSVKVDGVNVAPASAAEAAAGAGAGVAFGNVNDKNATLSSSPANPPAFNPAQPAKFGTVTAAPASDKLDIHSFFTGGGNPPAPAQGQPRASTFDPQARSPAHQTQPLPQMHAGTQPFNPRGGPQRIGNPSIPAFVPGQSQAGGYPSPIPQYSTSPYNSQPIPFKPAGTPSQNIPNGTPYGGPG